MGTDITWPGEPDMLAITQDVLEQSPQLTKAVRTSHDEGMQGDWTHERLSL